MQGALASAVYQRSTALSVRRPGGVRTQLVVVSGWTAAVTAMAIVLYPALAAALYALLVGLVLVVGLRVGPRGGALAAGVAAATFALTDLTVVAVTADPAAARLGPVGLVSHPAAHQAAGLAALVLGVLVLLTSAAMASGLSRALGRLSSLSKEAPPRSRTAND